LRLARLLAITDNELELPSNPDSGIENDGMISLLEKL
jgi:hypothetical protein